jgi:hypothetical protein
MMLWLISDGVRSNEYVKRNASRAIGLVRPSIPQLAKVSGFEIQFRSSLGQKVRHRKRNLSDEMPDALLNAFLAP